MINTAFYHNNLFISYEDKYIGKLKTYTNLFSKLFTSIFGISNKIKINNKIYIVDRKSLKEFLNQDIKNNESDIKTIIKNFTNNKPDYLTNQPYMRTQLNDQLRLKLNKKFLKALTKKNFIKAAELAHQGADIDLPFYLIKDKGLFYEEPSLESIDRSIIVTKYTPLIYAAEHSKDNLYQVIKKLGADASLKGESYLLNKSDKNTKLIKTSLIDYTLQGDELIKANIRKKT